MKNLLILSFLMLSVMSCGTDSDCVKDDFLGSYTGTSKCTGEDEMSVNAEVTEASGNSVAINIDGEVAELRIDGCNVEIPETTIDFLGNPVTSFGEGELNGNTLTINQTINFIGVTTNCNVTLRK
ncbi:MAG: hypothetical protein HKN51_03315 [Saprospiraceae bacterium]|nr:hypothetical protein [Saprospiraceae bacterium]